jgi:hypothetical protein
MFCIEAIFRIDPALDPISVQRAFYSLKLDFSAAPILRRRYREFT